MEKWLPSCLRVGMSEEQFWRSNPRIIAIYENAYRNRINEQNSLIHAWVGNYMLSAESVAFASVLTPMFSKGKHSSAKYIEEPIQIFEKTEEEKAAEYDLMTERYEQWCEMIVKQYSKT